MTNLSNGDRQPDTTKPLAGMRVLDLTDHRGEVGPWLLGELGADVIKVEPPGGTSARRELPVFEGGESDLASLQFCAYNSNKRSIVVDLDDEADRGFFLDLVGTADLLFESGARGTLAAHGIDREVLDRANSELVHVQLSPYGLDGPRAGDPAAEITVAALGGSANLQGIRDRAPVKATVPQVWRHAGAESAVAGLTAHARMRTSGGSQHVDLSAQAVMTWTLINAMEAHAIQGVDFERTGATTRLAVELDLRHAATDGYVLVLARGRLIRSILPWLIAEGIVDETWQEEDWATYDNRVLSGEKATRTFGEVNAAVAALCSRYDRDTLLRKALEYGETIAPINSVADLLALDHFEARELWRDAEIGEARAKLPGAHLSVDGVRVEVPRRPPLIDEHGSEIRAELASGKPRFATPSGTIEPRALPLEGLKVVDFSWVGVGPITAKCLADHGATVVRVESATRLDVLRLSPPFKDGVSGVNRSQFFGTFNTSKLSIDIDLKVPEGIDVARRLIEWADVVIESWTPGAFARLGFDADALREINPSAIVVGTSLLASGGPLSDVAGYGYHAAAMAGFYEIVGWPDLPPDGPYLAYTDTIAPRFVTATLLAAIAHRESTGEGCHIEVAQIECGLQFLAPELLDLQLNGRIARRDGNRDCAAAPQGMYPCLGDDRWVAISVPDDQTWARLVELLGSPRWAVETKLGTFQGRAAAHDELDRYLAEWTASQAPETVAARLNAVGVPAGMSQRSSDLLVDPQYEHRHFYHWLEHPEMGTIPYAGHQFDIAGYNHGPRGPAPLLGQHTFDVMTELLGMDGDEVAAIAVSGALG